MNRTIKNKLDDTRMTLRYISQGLLEKRPHMSYIGAWDKTPNLGDKALATAARLLFPQCGFIDYPCTRPEYFYKIAKRLRFIKYGLLAGGTLINRTDRALEMANECFPLCKKSIVFGSGVADTSFWKDQPNWHNNIDKWRPVLESCSYLGVRGPLSAANLIDAGFKNVEVIGDPILVCAEQRTSEHSKPIKRSIGLSISHPGIEPYENMWGSLASLSDQYIKLASILRQKGWKVRWLIADYRETEMVKKIAAASGTDQEIIDSGGNYKTWMDLVRPLSAFVGMKLHSVALATCAYVPSIMCEYRPKCADYMSYIGQESNTVRTDEFDADMIFQRVEDMDSQRQRYSGILYDSISPLKEKQIRKAQQLIRDLENDVI